VHGSTVIERRPFGVRETPPAEDAETGRLAI